MICASEDDFCSDLDFGRVDLAWLTWYPGSTGTAPLVAPASDSASDSDDSGKDMPTELRGPSLLTESRLVAAGILQVSCLPWGQYSSDVRLTVSGLFRCSPDYSGLFLMISDYFV